MWKRVWREREKRSFLGELSFVEAGERSFLEAGERVAGGKGPSPGRREPAGLRASLRHEQARGTSSEAVALRGDASQGSRNSHFLLFFSRVCVNDCGKAPVGSK